MKNEVEVPAPVAVEGNAEELFRWLGRRDAFSLMAGRCSAADVQCLKRIRDGKLYLGYATDWPEFCERFLHMSKSNANRLIALRDELGDAYFYIAQVTGISLKEYRTLIAPAVSEDGIRFEREVIPLIPENSKRVAETVSHLRAAADTRIQPAERDEVCELIARADGVIEKLRSIRRRRGKPDRDLTQRVSALLDRVARLYHDVG